MLAKLKPMRSCVIGWPVAHSRSPLIHNYWLKHYRLEGEYTKEAVAPGELPSFLQSLESRGFIGCNVTVPHKEEAARLVTPADSLTRRLAAVNTIYRDGSRLLGTNTDGFGFTAHLAASLPGLHLAGQRVLLLGAGGAARAIAGALLDMQIDKLFIANRTFDRAAALADCFGPRLEPVQWRSASSSMSGIQLFVNATSLGMLGKPELDISLADLPASAVVCDIVYVPLETELLRRARARGLRTVDGLGMLLHQACPAFEKWYGVAPAVTAELRELLIQDILHPSAP
jgi:shikimate dehydrogenase